MGMNDNSDVIGIDMYFEGYIHVSPQENGRNPITKATFMLTSFFA